MDSVSDKCFFFVFFFFPVLYFIIVIIISFFLVSGRDMTKCHIISYKILEIDLALVKNLLQMYWYWKGCVYRVILLLIFNSSDVFYFSMSILRLLHKVILFK